MAEQRNDAPVSRPAGMTRRWFIGATVGTSVGLVASVHPLGVAHADDDAVVPAAFEISAAAEVDVVIGAGARFDVTVLDRDGAELAAYPGLDVADLFALDTPWFDVVAVEPPQAA